MQEQTYKLIHKPQLDNFYLSYDGKLNKKYELKRRSKHAFKLALWAFLVAFLAIYDAINMFLQSIEQKRLERTENVSDGFYRLTIVKS